MQLFCNPTTQLTYRWAIIVAYRPVIPRRDILHIVEDISLNTRSLITISLFVMLLAACTPAATPAPDMTATINQAAVYAAETFTAVTDTPTPAPSATPTATATPLACWQQGGELVQETMHSERMNLPFEFDVYLPPCYAQQPDREYPVLYLIHGQSFRQDQWQRLGATTVADELVAAGEISPFILVMPRDPNWRQPIETEFDEVFIQELVPYIDANYRTLAERPYRAIGGLSRGAGWALHFGFSEWPLFGIVGMHSLPVLWGDAYLIPDWLDAIPLEQMPRIYMDIGDHDRYEIKQSAEEFEADLTVRGIPHEFYVYTGYHDEAYWGCTRGRVHPLLYGDVVKNEGLLIFIFLVNVQNYFTDIHRIIYIINRLT